MSFNRRDFSKKIGAGALLALGAGSVSAVEKCNQLLTPEQPKGPFYPLTIPDDSNLDLTRVEGRVQSAKGEVVIVKGRVIGENCKPIAGAVVEIWQACHTGKYNHPSDTSQNSLDPDFQYYGLVRTNKSGEYQFKTVLPGAYNATQDWVRPPHIHFKVSLRGYTELITQLYFKGEKLNKHDRILQQLAPSEQKSVVIPFTKNSESSVKEGVFDITLKSL